MQPENGLYSVVYDCKENSKLDNKLETFFPGLVAINGYVEKGEHIKISAIKVSDHDNSEMNYQKFLGELNKISSEKGFTYDLEIIKTSEDLAIKKNLSLFKKLIKSVGNDEELYASINYGFKPTPIILSMALNYAYQICENTDIGCILYGQFNHVTKKSTIYDTTALFYMDGIVNTLAKNKVKDSSKMMDFVLGEEYDDDDDEIN
jgi:hypothetical protein